MLHASAQYGAGHMLTAFLCARSVTPNAMSHLRWHGGCHPVLLEELRLFGVSTGCPDPRFSGATDDV